MLFWLFGGFGGFLLVFCSLPNVVACFLVVCGPGGVAGFGGCAHRRMLARVRGLPRAGIVCRWFGGQSVGIGRLVLSLCAGDVCQSELARDGAHSVRTAHR